ncbi:transposase [Streptomyces anthocyanicus]|uniref:transposase n=1 Tax=Streptomyces anthocyanicus TaxID=68174 RepID=UPI003870BCB0
MGRRITLRPQAEYEAIQQARAQEDTQEWKEQYAHRAGVEGRISQGVRAFGLRRCRYHGLDKARLQHQLTATAMNFHRLNAWWNDTPKARTRTSHVAALRLLSRFLTRRTVLSRPPTRPPGASWRTVGQACRASWSTEGGGRYR